MDQRRSARSHNRLQKFEFQSDISLIYNAVFRCKQKRRQNIKESVARTICYTANCDGQLWSYFIQVTTHTRPLQTSFARHFRQSFEKQTDKSVSYLFMFIFDENRDVSNCSKSKQIRRQIQTRFPFNRRRTIWEVCFVYGRIFRFAAVTLTR